MSLQLDLLPHAGLMLSPEPGRLEPRFWVRRLVIWEKPGLVLRDISLRPGLNILWSPDPADPGQTGASSSDLGHGSGKTLFCRLLRYVLGEDRYSPDGQRFLIGKAYPEGMVGAEVMIDGTQWAVLRSIGHVRRHCALPDRNLDGLLAGEVADTGMAPFLKALEKTLLTEPVVELIPVDHQLQAWLVALAWMSRDQECRFDKVLDWRSVDSDSDSPARGLSTTRLLDTLRALIGAIYPEEYRLRAEIGVLEDRHKVMQQESARLAWGAERLRSRLIADLELEAKDVLPGRLGVGTLRQAAKARLARMATISPDVDVADLEDLRTQTADAERQANNLKHGLAELRARIPEIEALIRRIKGELPGLSVEIDNRTNPLCPVCEVPISRALAEGCGLSDKPFDLDAVRQRFEDLNRDLKREQDRLQNDLDELERFQQALIPALELAEDLGARLRGVERQRDDRSDTWFNTRRWLDDADRLEADFSAHENSLAALEALARDIEKIREHAAAFRDAQAEVFTRLSQFFDAIIREVVGASAGGKVTLDGNGLKLTVEMGGDRSTAAIDSLKVIAFDLAVMCMSIEGNARLPAFFIHDSPREADLGLSVYHRLFHLVRDLEERGGQPLFQYIVTTTTRPPDGLQEKPWLCEVLGGAPADKRLMRCDL